MPLIVNTTKNVIEVAEKRVTLTAKITNNIVSVAPIGIQGESGNLVVSSGDANKILTNNGTSVEWVTTPTNITLNGGYF